MDIHLSEPFPIHVVTVPGRHRAPRVKAFTEFMISQLDDALAQRVQPFPIPERFRTKIVVDVRYSWLDPSETRRIGRLAHMIGRLRCS